MPELTDVVVVGGGILGVALAEELAMRTLRVVLLAANRLADGATGNGFAWINATAKDDDETYHRLNALGVARYDALAVQWGMETIGLHGGGALFWANGTDTAECQRLHERAARLQAWSYPVALLSQNEMRTLEPQACFRSRFMEGAEGLFAPADRWVDARRLIRFLAERLRRQGGDLRENCPALGFTLDVNRAISTVRTSEGLIATRLLILAAGVQTPNLASQVTGDPTLEARFPLQRVPGLLVETASGSAPEQAHRVLYPADPGGLHLRPTPTGGLLLGADDVDAALASDAQPGLESSLAAILARAAHFFPDLSASALVQEATARICVRPFPADGHPIVGPLPGVKNVYVALTHSGITLGPLLASLIAEEIQTGHVPALLRPYRPDRFGYKIHPR